MSPRPASPALRPVRDAPARALEVRAREAVERALRRDGCERVLIVYEKADPLARTAPTARVYGEDESGAPRKLEVLR